MDRSVLLGVARRAFAESGYAGASLSRIADRSGLTKSSLLHHFTSKDRLYEEVLTDVLVDLHALLPSPTSAWVPALDQLGLDVTDYLVAHPDAARLLVRELAGGTAPTEIGVKAVEATLLATAQFLERGMAELHVPRQDPLQLSMSIIGLHLIWFAATDVSRIAAGADVFSPTAVHDRAVAVLEQVRRMCGLTPT